MFTASPRAPRRGVIGPRVAWALLASGTSACALGASRVLPEPQPAPVLAPQASGTTALLQAVSVVNERVVWVSGHAGTYAVTTDGGANWRAAVVPGADSLQFRDVHAADANTAYLLAAGPGERSRIYKTTDAGAHWQLQFTNRDSSAFYDCFDFWDARHGVAVSDAVNGRLPILVTTDGGAHWTGRPGAAVPPALPGEGAFAASGTCLVVGRGGRAWVGTGATEGARVYLSEDYGATWTVAPTPIVSGPASGIASVAFRDERHGIALGGRIGDPHSLSDNIAITEDGGATWRLAGRPTFAGAIYGAAWVPGAPAPTVVAVGPRGMGYSTDEGRSWTSLDTLAYWSVGFASPRAGWAVGPGGRISKISFAR